MAIPLVLIVTAGCTTVGFGGFAAAHESDDGPRESIVEVEDYGTVELETITYHGDLILDVTNAWILGAGSDTSIVNGDRIISGNRNEIRGIRVTGTVRISGNRNKIIHSGLSNTTIIDTGEYNEY